MAIPLTAGRGPVEFIPPSLEKREPPLIILVRVPTMYERDSYAAKLVRGGVVHYSKKQIRDLLLAGVEDQYPAAEFDEIVAGLEELWAVTDEEQAVNLKRAERLVELLDVPKGTKAPTKKKIEDELNKIVAEVKMDRPKRVRIFSIQQKVMSSYAPLAAVLADLAEQEAARAWLQAEIYVTGWKGLELEPEGNGKGGLQRHEVDYLRRHIGSDGWVELSDFITALHGIDGDEEKNLASLLESMSARIGSTPKESPASSENGSSTGGPSSQTQGGGSAKTTASSTGSGTSSGTKTG